MIKKVLALLATSDKRYGLFVTLIVSAQAILEVAGAASIVPLLILLVGTKDPLQDPNFQTAIGVLHDFGLAENIDLLLFFIGALFLLTLLVLIMRSLSSYCRHKFAERVRFSIGQRLLKSYLSQSYTYFLQQNSSDLSKNLLAEVDQVVGKVVINLINMIANVLISLGLLSFLFYLNATVAFSILGIIGGIYLLIYFSVSRHLYSMGQERLARNKQRFIFAGEIFSGIKAIKILGVEDASSTKFLKPNRRFSVVNARMAIINEIPTFLVEAIAIAALIVLTYLVSSGILNTNTDELVPLLGVYAYSFYKIKPALTSIFKAAAALRYSEKTIERLYADMDMQQPQAAELHARSNEVKLIKRLAVENVDYFYPSATKPALRDISLEIRAGACVAIVGSTGSGKTTLINIILSLLMPTNGRVFVDNTELDDANARQWQSSIGYVSQDIFMIDATVAENIAFGLQGDEIDLSAVKRAAEMAKISGFINDSLPDKYDTVIGDRGIRLSGGERQRLGIARALYTDPNVLIFDEATSALDNLTEKAIIEEIHSLAKKKTIIMIAHRLSTVKKCDAIIVLNDGRIEATGTYGELLEKTNSFANMADV